jgi:hypothetical protein
MGWRPARSAKGVGIAAVGSLALSSDRKSISWTRGGTARTAMLR